MKYKKDSQYVPNQDALSPNCAQGIAIVGMAFRFPGDLADEDSLWDALGSGRDLVTEVPASRWAVDELQHGKRSEPGRSITFAAGVLSRIDEFDAAFFGISPREAAWLDPQQRLLLELSWEAMENGGLPASSLAGSDCAVYVGISSLDYGTRGLDDLASMSSHSMTGNTLSVAANRLSYVFDLHGPSLAVDTACSSSLVALHHACNTLHAGEASMALVGGVNLLLHPYPFVGFTKASMISAGGRCKPFDASGDGYVRAEGGAVLLLKPVAQAIADGDEIHAVILASGVNADGARKTGITIPSSDGQAELMRTVLARSGLAAADIDFVEAHGTGTAIGDPIETAAIGSVYGRERATPLPIGSVKANLGHLEPASGMAGLVKTVLALKHGALPPALHLKTLNPKIDFVGLNIAPVTEYRELGRQGDKPLVAGVNSFGFGGANAHVLVREHRGEGASAALCLPTALPPLVLSARSGDALRALAEGYASMLAEASPETAYDIAYGAAYRRDRLEKRLIVSGQPPGEMVGRLRQFAQGAAPAGLFVEDGLPETGGVAFIYSGNGAQWLGMGRKLLQESPRAAEILAQLDLAIAPQAGFSLLEELHADNTASRLADTVVAQPLLFALQVAVTLLLKEQGIAPMAVAGHSVGEVAAAWAAGALDLEQAIRVICARSAAQGLTRGTGRMAAVGLAASAMADTLRVLGLDPAVEIAGINSARNVTISGDLADLERIGADLEAKGVFFRLLDLDYAFHSRRMDPIRNDLAGRLAGLSPAAAGKAVLVSTVCGDAIEGEALDAGYWWRNVREPVRFAEAIGKLAGMGCRVFVEIGPHAILQRYIAECLTAANVRGRVLPTLTRTDDGFGRLRETALRSCLLADKEHLEHHFPVLGRRVRLPNYPWQRERHWHPRTSEGLSSIERRRVHPLLGWRLPDAEAAWENTLDPMVLPWLADHQVGGAVVLPGAAYLEMALAAAREWFAHSRLVVEELDIISPMVFDGDHARSLRLTLNTRDGSFQIKARQRLASDEWALHATGRLLEGAIPEVAGQIAAAADTGRRVDHATHYRLAARLGLDYGPAFQGLAEARVDGDRLEAALELPESVHTATEYLIHPAVLDVCYQSLVDFFQDDIEAGEGVALLPIRLGELRLLSAAPIVGFRAELVRQSPRSVLVNFELFDALGHVAAVASGCRFRAAPLKQRQQAAVDHWQIVPRLQPHPVEGLASEITPASELARQLTTWFNDNEASLQRQTWFMETLPLFEALVLSFIHEAFRGLAAQRPDWLQQALAATEGGEGRSPYVQWAATCLQQENLLTNVDGVWCLRGEEAVPASQDIWQAILRDAPACLPHLVLFGRVGARLPALLTGEVDAGAFRETLRYLPSAETLHEDDPAYLGSRLAAQQTLCTLAANWPTHRKLRILEVSTDASELPRVVYGELPEDRLTYVLALPHDETRQRCQSEFHDFANIAVAGIDFDQWALTADQPLPELFDVVVLRHVLHRAASPLAAVAQSRRWLAPGGLLLVAERYPDWSADFVAGLDPAWWHRGGDGKYQSTLVAPSAWQEALRDESFAEIEVLAEPAVAGLAEGTYLLIAKRSAEESIALPDAPVAGWLLLTDAGSAPLAEHLLSRLEAQGQRAHVGEVAERLEDVDHVVYMRGWNTTAEVGVDLPADLLHQMQALLAAQAKAPRLWIVTRGGALAADLPAGVKPDPVQAALWGLGRVAMNEAPNLCCTLLDLACEPCDSATLNRLENELLRPDGSSEIVLASGGRYVLTMRAVPPGVAVGRAGEAEHYRLDFAVPGQLRNLHWLPETSRPLQDHEIEVRTQATGLNFRDVMYVMGLLPDEAVENGFSGASLGLEFSGVVTRVGAKVRDHEPGDSVMGFGPACFASHVVTRADAVASMPEGWSFAAAATVPTVFFTVYYALKHLADLQPGERVLIHGGAGGVGIAAIQLARHLGAEIFATAGSDEKRDFVRLLGADHVFDSRSLAYAEQILAATAGEGVDVVLNSLAGEAIRRNLRVIKPFGRFLELGKRDFFENTPIGLRPFKDNISYFGIDADQLLTGRPALAARLFREVMALFREGVLSPLPWRAFPATRIVDAFRVMQQARHIGKVVVDLAAAAPALAKQVESPVRMGFAQHSTWLISGGLSGFGLETARWLVARGVGHLVLLGRRGSATPGAAEAVVSLQEQGVTVQVIACDITDRTALAAAFERIRQTLPPLAGVVHAATAYDDGLLASLDAERMASVLRPKLLGAWNLHQLTLNIPLAHFVLYSSITTFIGNPGQGNYVAANAGLEGLAALRLALGLPATCIGWGPIGDTGYLTRNEAVKDALAQRLGKAPLSSAEALAQLDRLLTERTGPRAAANFDWPVLCRLLPSAQSARFTELNRGLQDGGGPQDNADFRALIAGKSSAEVTEIVRNLVAQEVAQILCIGVERIEPGRSLHELGMDSLMAVELALGLEQRFGIKLPVMILNESPTTDRVAARIVDNLLGGAEDAEAARDTVGALVENIARQHGETVTPEEIESLAADTRRQQN